eukprot:1187288-Amphidinium_carterae.1
MARLRNLDARGELVILPRTECTDQNRFHGLANHRYGRPLKVSTLSHSGNGLLLICGHAAPAMVENLTSSSYHSEASAARTRRNSGSLHHTNVA